MLIYNIYPSLYRARECPSFCGCMEVRKLENKPKSTAIYIKGGKGNKVVNNHIEGFDIGVYGEDTDDLEVYSNIIKDLDTKDYDTLKSEILMK